MKGNATGVGIGTVEDIFVNKIPNTVSIGGSLRIGIGNTTETLQVLNIFNLNKVLRVFRNVNHSWNRSYIWFKYRHFK
ncbi:MAG: hypothetical protein CM15mP113_2000 [Pseudomonadota bacterium]|nr:MAG: hypothetical protein CM15mP113_2000 [Pseudomonadota bacterium]